MSAIDGRQLGLPNIAFCGRAGAGKSTAAQQLTQFGYEVRSFATPLKEVAAWLWGDEARTDREKLQRLGVACREICPDTWVELYFRKHKHTHFGLQAPREFASPVAVDDLRFENEWWALKAQGYVIVRLKSPVAVRVDRLKGNGKFQSIEQLEHVSESAVDHLVADYEIDNTDTKSDLEDELVEILLKERRRR